MTGRIDFDRASDELIVSFRFDRATKDAVKSLPGARFDWNAKVWRFSLDNAPHVVAVLAPRGFEIAPEIASILESLGPGGATPSAAEAPDRPAAPEPGSAPPTVSVCRLNAEIGRTLNTRFGSPFWVSGELSNFNRSSHRRHVHFELVETDDDGRPIATIQAIMFASARQRMERSMKRAGLAFEDGLSVRLLVKVEFYAERARVQLVIEDVDIAWSAGELAIRREEILAELRSSGLATRQLELPLPSLPLRVALLTSVGSDAYHDVLSSLTSSGFGFRVMPFDVRVQGSDLEATVCSALRTVARNANAFDVVVLTRGGGSRVELAQWDNLRVALAVAGSPVKIIVAIGHHQDRCVLDDIALSCKTPTEAGELLAGTLFAAAERVERLGEKISARVVSRMQVERTHLQNAARLLASATRRRLSHARSEIDHSLPRLIAGAARREIVSARRDLEALSARIAPERVRGALQRRNDHVARLGARLDRASQTRIREANAGLILAAAQVRLVDPENVLKRGFALVRAPDGELLTRAAGLTAGDRVEVQMSDARIRAQVTKSSADMPSPNESSQSRSGPNEPNRSSGDSGE